MTAAEDDFRRHLMRQINQLTTTVPLRELTTAEMVSLVSLLIPAHTRVLEATAPTAQVLQLVSR
jgi:hypothetical protein